MSALQQNGQECGLCHRRGLMKALKCSVENCQKKLFRRDLCSTHYTRLLRHGDVDCLKRAENGRPLAWLKKRVEHADEVECLLWPFGFDQKSGYGAVGVGKKTVRAHRHMCFLAHGAPPFPRADACHSCNNRLCVNPNHLRWDTRKANMADKISAGTNNSGERHGHAKLTEGTIQYIRASDAASSQLAKELNVRASTIWKIRRRKAWTHI